MTAAIYSLSLARPAPVAVPRGALWVGWMADLVVAWRARQRLERRAQDAASLRRWAQRLQVSEPSLAADLRAAADRHSEGC
jgi:hypothetical protein